MVRIVIDTNRLFSALLSRNRVFRELLFSDQYIFFSAKFLIVEIFKHKERILKSAKTENEGDIYEYLNEVLQRIRFINEDFISLTNYSTAYKLCKEIDENDTPFVALTLQLNAQLWTQDEKLKKHLRKKGFNNFFEP